MGAAVILNREQIDALESNYADEISASHYAALRDTARAYHDLRDAVLALCVNSGIRHNGEGRWIAESDIREVVARVERGE